MVSFINQRGMFYIFLSFLKNEGFMKVLLDSSKWKVMFLNFFQNKGLGYNFFEDEGF